LAARMSRATPVYRDHGRSSTGEAAGGRSADAAGCDAVAAGLARRGRRFGPFKPPKRLRAGRFRGMTLSPQPRSRP
jgi:hypothetical protein